jgi:hypothetical protein
MRDYGYSISHSSRYSVLNDEDDLLDDCASLAEVDETAKISFTVPSTGSLQIIQRISKKEIEEDLQTLAWQRIPSTLQKCGR